MHQIFSLTWWRMLFSVKYWRHRQYIHLQAKAMKVNDDPRPYWAIVISLWLDHIKEEVEEEKREHGGFG